MNQSSSLTDAPGGARGGPWRPESTTSGPDVPEEDQELPSYARAIVEGASPPASPPVPGDDKRRRPSSLLDDFFSPGTALGSADPDSVAGPSSPPLYTRHDPAVRTYTFRPPVIYACTGDAAVSSTLGSPAPPASPPEWPEGPERPAYHVSSLRTHAMALAPLTPSNARLISLRGDGGGGGGAGAYKTDALGRRVRTVPFDEETALYVCTRSPPLLGRQLSSLEIEPLKAPPRTVPGQLKFEQASAAAVAIGAGGRGALSSLMGKNGGGPAGVGKFWHRTRRAVRGDKERAEDERRMNRYGYHPAKEWSREVLFGVETRRTASWGARGGFEWRDSSGRVVAIETFDEQRGGAFRLDFVTADGPRLGSGMASPSPGCGTTRSDERRVQVAKEILLTCWVGRIWASGCMASNT